MQVQEIFIWGKKRKNSRQISLLDDYYYYTTSVGNQNAGFALALQLGDTNMELVYTTQVNSTFRAR